MFRTSGLKSASATTESDTGYWGATEQLTGIRPDSGSARFSGSNRSERIQHRDPSSASHIQVLFRPILHCSFRARTRFG